MIYAISALIVVQVLGTSNMNTNAKEAKSDNTDQPKPSKITSGQPEVPPFNTSVQN